MFWVEPLQCNSLLFNRVKGQVEVLTGQVNFRGSLARSESNALEPMLHPARLLTNFEFLSCHAVRQGLMIIGVLNLLQSQAFIRYIRTPKKIDKTRWVLDKKMSYLSIQGI